MVQLRGVDVVADCRKMLISIWGKGLRKFLITHFPCNYIIFTKKNQNQLIAQYSFLLVFRFAACFDQFYWSSSGNHIQRYINLSHVVTAVVYRTIKMGTIGLQLKYSTDEIFYYLRRKNRKRRCLDTKNNCILYCYTARNCILFIFRLYFNYNPILIILITVNTTAAVTTLDNSKLKHCCMLVPEDGQYIWPKHVADLNTNKKEYCETSWF